MKTKEDIEARLEEVIKDQTVTLKRFQEYDNHHDLEELNNLVVRIEVLKWVLSN